mmetsp:Transcript_36041/g.39834  ORF Transcript_36041/g.39834 Transcript_36041/m.39834 type:complete len:284 (+) Transcript_36041:102-953(+)
MKDEIIGTINAMKEQEKSVYRTECGLYTRSKGTSTVYAHCRRIIIACFKHFAKLCNFGHNTVAIAVNTLDRFVAKEPRIISSDDYILEFKLVAMTSLYTSVKVHEGLALDSTTISRLSNYAFSSKQIEVMETIILKKLGWRINAPTAMSFAEMYLLILLPPNEQTTTSIRRLIQCQIEHTMEDCQFLGIDASEIAFTAVYNAIMVTYFNQSSRCRQNMQQAINVNFLPFKLENILMNCMVRSESRTILSLRISATQTIKGMRKYRKLLPKSVRYHLSPRSVTI